MISNRCTLAAAGMIFCRLLAVFIPSLLVLNAASTQEEAKPTGFVGEEEVKGDGTTWKQGETTFWIDVGDDVDPQTPGCHVEVRSGTDLTPIGRKFGEFCGRDGYLRETTPEKNKVHAHPNDIGHPYVIDCNKWCQDENFVIFDERRMTVVTGSQVRGVCQPVNRPSPCSSSAVCFCSPAD